MSLPPQTPLQDNPAPAITSTPPPNILEPPPRDLPSRSPSAAPAESVRTLRIGTRASALALAQVDIFTTILRTLHPNLPTAVIPISVAGDRDKTTNLHTLAQTGKSLWTEELEVLLLKGEIDCIVHSLKDVPTKVVAGCEIKVVGERGERRDCVVFPLKQAPVHSEVQQADTSTTAVAVNGSSLPAAAEGQENTTIAAASDEQPSPNKKRRISSPVSPQPPRPRRLADLLPNSVVGTSSIRRQAMIRRRYPTLRIQDMRGNVGTRLRKLDDPALGFDCLILAGAGIQRIGFGDRVGEWLDPVGVDGESEADGTGGGGGLLHAVGQGAIGLEIREGDEWVSGLLEGRDGQSGVVVNRVSWECQAERSLLRTLEGGCSVPVGVSCLWEASPLDDKGKKDGGQGAADHATIATQDQLSEPADGPTATHNTNSETSNNATTSTPPSPPPTTPSPSMMAPGNLHITASVTSVNGTECVTASRRQYVSSDKEADEAGWEVARVLVDRGAGKILEAIELNRGMIERGDGA
ncbi:MAG: hypothetical protein Q9220_005266 [cf. Caloplaca sp. 1 TL-2023]